MPESAQSDNRLAHAVKRLLTRLSVAPFRVAAFLFHTTGLERIYKPRFERHSALLHLTDDVVAKLPKHCNTMSGAQGDPMNLIFVGHEADIKRVFRQAEWHRANPASPIHVLYGLLMALLKKSYKTGPFAPLYVNIALQDLAYQQSERKGNFRQRHHLRIWRTGIRMPDGKRVWIAAAGREDGMKLAWALPFWTHALDSDIDSERDYVVKTLEGCGAARLKQMKMNAPVPESAPRKTVFGSAYYTDGQAVVVEV
jgi:hypothetical protein